MKAKLKKIAHIRNGYQFRGRIEPIELEQVHGPAAPVPPGMVRVIQIKDVDDDWRLRTDELDVVAFDRDPTKYEAGQGDVLFLGRGQRLFATAITDPVRDAVATGYFFILRPKADTILPRYLAWYINQPPFQSALRTVMKGTLQPLVSRKDIEDLRVEVPPPDIQQAVTALDDLRVREQHLLASLRRKRSDWVSAISMQAVRGSHEPMRTIHVR